ncbi:MAG: hypothetical protein HC849_18720 [Oscillatoriales cyanobacterium RU_3_3]|nr:hypothetical protein [Oscillatoriales cyanobacterium RU_3_3]
MKEEGRGKREEGERGRGGKWESERTTNCQLSIVNCQLPPIVPNSEKILS